MTPIDASPLYCLWAAHYPPHVGGVEQYTYNLAHALAKRGNRVVVVTTNLFDSPSDEVESDGVRVIRLPSYRLMRGRLPIPKRNTEYKTLLAELKQLPVSGVLVNTRFYGHSLEGMKFAHDLGIRPIVLDHGTAYLTIGNSIADLAIKAYERGITARGKKYRPRYFGVSQASCRWLENFNIEAEGVLSNSIDARAYRNASSRRDILSELGIPSHAKSVAFVGRFSPEKGIKQLSRAASLLEDENIVFLAAGNGTLLDEVKGSAPKNLFCLGSLDAADVSALLQQSQVFCLPSRSEGFCTALLEAGACGCIPVITHVGGTDELILSEEYGTILSSVDPETIANALRKVFDKLSRNEITGSVLARLVEEQYSWDSAAVRVESVFGSSIDLVG